MEQWVKDVYRLAIGPESYKIKDHKWSIDVQGRRYGLATLQECINEMNENGTVD